MFRPNAFRNTAVIALAFCLALGGIVHHGGRSTCAVDPSESESSQDSKHSQPVRDRAAIAPTTHVPHARAANLHRTPVIGLKSAGSQAAAPQISALLANRRLPFPRTRAFTPRSGRSPPPDSL
jgi:hypothetical protein